MTHLRLHVKKYINLEEALYAVNDLDLFDHKVIREAKMDPTLSSIRVKLSTRKSPLSRRGTIKKRLRYDN